MPTHETRIAARNPDGVEVYFQHSTLPSKENVEAYESYHSGAAKIMLDMAAEENSANYTRCTPSKQENIIK